MDSPGQDVGLSSWALVSGRVLAQILDGDVDAVANDDGTAFVDVWLSAHPGLVLASYDDDREAERLVRREERVSLARAYRRMMSEARQSG